MRGIFQPNQRRESPTPIDAVVVIAREGCRVRAGVLRNLKGGLGALDVAVLAAYGFNARKEERRLR